jgi:hypothetical protein
MDEMSMVRRLLAESPPAPHVVAEGRKRLFASPDRGIRRTRTASGVHRTRMSRPAAFWSTLGLTGAAAAALAVATLPGPGTSLRAGDPATADGSARTVLLAAAARAEGVPTSGTYWHVRTMQTTTGPQKLGRREDRYTVELLSVNEEWTKRNGQAWRGRREWVRPKTREDEAAWRRDGSPSKWCMGETDTEPPEPICLRTAPGTASLMKAYHALEVAEGRELTFAQLQWLPENPDALRAWVVDAVKDDLDPSASAEVVDYNVADVLANLLVDVPVPPGVRAAAYGALADMPNVKSTGPTRDELGRVGVGILIDDGLRAHVAVPGFRRFKTGELSRTLIIDPETSYVLATQTSIGTSSAPFGGTLILEVGWTNEKPHKPAMP